MTRNWWLVPTVAITLLSSAEIEGGEYEKLSSERERHSKENVEAAGPDGYSVEFAGCYLSIIQLDKPHQRHTSHDILIRLDGGDPPGRIQAWIGGATPSGDALPVSCLLNSQVCQHLRLRCPSMVTGRDRHTLWIEVDLAHQRGIGRAAFPLRTDSHQEVL